VDVDVSELLLSHVLIAANLDTLPAFRLDDIDIKSREEDARIINNHPYEQGRDVPTARITEALILQRTAEMLIARARDIADEIKAEMDG
jgi:hypothetical protein